MKGLLLCHTRATAQLLFILVNLFYGLNPFVEAAVPWRTFSYRYKRNTATRSNFSSQSITDCDSLSFLFQDRQASFAKSSLSTQTVIVTHVGEVSKYFNGILIDDDNDISIPKLLIACTHFADAMVRVDQRQSARDMRQNVRKVESNGQKDVTSMRELLRYEKLHSPDLHRYNGETLVRLGEHSCAIGLLWIRRSLEFQYKLFEELLENNEAAVQEAYKQTLFHFHGWGLQKVYAIALKATSGSVLATTAQLGGFDPKQMTKEEYDATRRDLKSLMEFWQPLLNCWNQIYDELNLQDLRKV